VYMTMKRKTPITIRHLSPSTPTTPCFRTYHQFVSHFLRPLQEKFYRPDNEDLSSHKRFFFRVYDNDSHHLYSPYTSPSSDRPSIRFLPCRKFSPEFIILIRHCDENFHQTEFQIRIERFFLWLSANWIEVNWGQVGVKLGSSWGWIGQVGV
jgi:hypothetical protein